MIKCVVYYRVVFLNAGLVLFIKSRRYVDPLGALAYIPATYAEPVTAFITIARTAPDAVAEPVANPAEAGIDIVVSDPEALPLAPFEALPVAADREMKLSAADLLAPPAAVAVAAVSATGASEPDAAALLPALALPVAADNDIKLGDADFVAPPVAPPVAADRARPDNEPDVVAPPPATDFKNE